MKTPRPTTDPAAGDSPYAIGVIGKMAEVLDAFSHARPSMGLKELAEATGMPKTTVFRILSTLTAIDFIEYDAAAGTYSLGFALLRLAEVRRRQHSVHDAALPVMRELRNESGETVVLSVRTGEQRIHIDVVESFHALRRSAELGVGAPLYAGAASKTLLSGMSDAEIADYLARTPLKAFQDTTITDAGELMREIATIRAQGFAESRGELISGGGSLAAPIRDYAGQVVGVIDILTPESRYTPEHRERCIALLKAAAGEVSRRLGFAQRA